MAKRDPRRFITPDAFTVSKNLLGVALARPSRRLFAIAIDGLCIAILSRVGGKMLLAFLASIMLWRAGNRSSAERVDDRRTIRLALRIASVIAIFLFSLTVWKWVSKHMPGNDNKHAQSSAARPPRYYTPSDSGDGDGDDPADAGDGPMSGLSFDTPNGKVNIARLGLTWSDRHMFPMLTKLGDASDSASAALATDSIARWLLTKPDSSRRSIATALDNMFDDSPGGAAVRASLQQYLPPAPTDTLARRNLALRRELNATKKENAALKADQDKDKTGFVKRMLKALSDILGFGFGWSALYFTTFTTLMRGQTPGKRVLGIRVIRLDEKVLTGWMSFERFGGYAASAATGLLGFAQILWDRNRQALHDKVAETVVVRVVNGEPVRPPEAAEYAAAARRTLL